MEKLSLWPPNQITGIFILSWLQFCYKTPLASAPPSQQVTISPLTRAARNPQGKKKKKTGNLWYQRLWTEPSLLNQESASANWFVTSSAPLANPVRYSIDPSHRQAACDGWQLGKQDWSITAALGAAARTCCSVHDVWETSEQVTPWVE